METHPAAPELLPTISWLFCRRPPWFTWMRPAPELPTVSVLERSQMEPKPVIVRSPRPVDLSPREPVVPVSDVPPLIVAVPKLVLPMIGLDTLPPAIGSAGEMSP